MTSNRTWIGAAVLISLIALLAGWFLGISPQLAEAAKSTVKTLEIDALNEVHEAELAVMKEQFGAVAETEAKLVALRSALPPAPAYPDFVREVYTAAESAGVSVSNFTAAAAVRYSPLAAEIPVEPAGDDASESPIASVATVPSAAPVVTSPLITPENFVIIPVTIQVDGGFENFRTFTASLQAGSRLFLVTGLTAVADTAAPAKGVATSYHGTITGNIYVLADPTLARTATDPEAAVELPEADIAELPTPTSTPTPAETPAPAETPTPGQTPTPTGTPAP